MADSTQRTRFGPRALWRRALSWADRLGPLPGRIRRGPARGLRLRAPASRLSVAIRGCYEPAVLAALEAACRPGSHAVDLGAHLGLTSMVLAKAVGATGRVFAFEPQAIPRALLERNLAANGLSWAEVVPLAAADRSGEARLSRERNDAMARLLPADGPTQDAAAGETVHRMRLDHWWATFVDGGILAGPEACLDVLKVDVEGGELAALRGAEDLLERFRPVLVVEAHRAPWLGEAPRELVAWLRQQQYRVAALADLAPAGDEDPSADRARPSLSPTSADEALLDRRLDAWTAAEPRGMEILHLLARRPSSAN